jgi:hypothetical protein
MSITAFTRLSTANTYDNSLRNLQERQTNLANMQENLTSGKRITSASDDPTGAAQAERASPPTSVHWKPNATQLPQPKAHWAK